MMYSRNGWLLCECDGCGKEETGDASDLQGFIRDLQIDGWKIRKKGDSWEHYCDECVGEVS